jgi:uncharacterized SAM-binding protein YcdF (DUF218 family)
MGFFLSKLFFALLTPTSLLLLALLGAWWWQRRRPRLSRSLVGACILFLFALGTMPLVHWTAAPLESRFPQPGELKKVDGIVVLGGALDTGGTLDLRQPLLNSAAERMTAGVALSRQYPQARLLFSGGSGLLRPTRYNESQVARALFESLGVDPARALYEDRSRNTWENALYSKKLADPKPGETWLLVTSAWHMPRAVGCFRQAGWNVVAYPVDYVGNDAGFGAFNAAQALTDLSGIEKEWIGLLAYHFMHRTDALFPAP